MNKTAFWVIWWSTFVMGLVMLAGAAFVAVHFLSKIW